jgi:hypothetical protein
MTASVFKVIVKTIIIISDFRCLLYWLEMNNLNSIKN